MTEVKSERCKFGLGLSRVVESFSFIPCPWTKKWTKRTCPTKIYLPENGHFSLFSSRNKKNIYVYLIIWMLFLARAMKYLFQDK